MNITVFGANGQIGQQFVQIALQNGHNVKAVVRREGALALTHPHLEILIVNYQNEAQVTAVIQGQDAVVSTLGPSMNNGRKVVTLPIRDTHAMILKVMEVTGVKRFITLGTPSISSDQDNKQLAIVFPATMPRIVMPPAYAEMKGIEAAVKSSKVDWTVIRMINPNVKSDGHGYTTSFGDTKTKFNVSRKNVATCMYDAIQKTEWIGKMPIVFNK